MPSVGTTAPSTDWRLLPGPELVDALDERTLADIVPSASGIYIWRRSIRAPLNAQASSHDCSVWIAELTRQPAARLTRRPLSYCVWTEGLQIGGGGLSAAKDRTLRDAAEHRKIRRLLARFTESLSQFVPVIYVGEATSLFVRVRQHLRGETGLQQYIFDELQLTWNEMDLLYFILTRAEEPTDKARIIQQLFEMIAQRLLAPFATKRPG